MWQSQCGIDFVAFCRLRKKMWRKMFLVQEKITSYDITWNELLVQVSCMFILTWRCCLDIKWHGRNLIVIITARGLFVQHPLSVFIFYFKWPGRSDFSVFPAFFLLITLARVCQPFHCCSQLCDKRGNNQWKIKDVFDTLCSGTGIEVIGEIVCLLFCNIV